MTIKILITCFLTMIAGNLLAQKEGYDPELAASYKADDYGMKTYVMAFLMRGDRVDEYTAEQRAEIQKGHMANMTVMAEAKKLVLAGPFIKGGDYRGIYIFDVADLAEAEALTNTDPAIIAGVLKMDLKLWYGSAAVMAIPELHPKIQKVDF